MFPSGGMLNAAPDPILGAPASPYFVAGIYSWTTYVPSCRTVRAARTFELLAVTTQYDAVTDGPAG